MSGYEQLPAEAYKELVLGGGVLAKSFDPITGTLLNKDVIAAVQRAVFMAVPVYADMGDVSENCPKGTARLKRLDGFKVRLSGKFLNISALSVKRLLTAAEISSDNEEKVLPKSGLSLNDCEDLWYIADYSRCINAQDSGFFAVKLKNAVSDIGVKLTAEKRGKGRFDFSFTAQPSESEPKKPPFEIYIRKPEAAENS